MCCFQLCHFRPLLQDARLLPNITGFFCAVDSCFYTRRACRFPSFSPHPQAERVPPVPRGCTVHLRRLAPPRHKSKHLNSQSSIIPLQSFVQLYFCKSPDEMMTAVGFEPTHPKIVELESTALDHSAKLSVQNFDFSFWSRHSAGLSAAAGTSSLGIISCTLCTISLGSGATGLPVYSLTAMTFHLLHQFCCPLMRCLHDVQL